MTGAPKIAQPGMIGRLAGARCPACGGGLSVWNLMQTGRIGRGHLSAARTLPFIHCPSCHVPVALGGSALWQRTTLFAIIVPLVIASIVISFVVAVLLGVEGIAALMLLIVGAELVLLPIILTIRLLGVERRDIEGPAGDT